jgi:hypothetical protein
MEAKEMYEIPSLVTVSFGIIFLTMGILLLLVIAMVLFKGGA